MVPSGPIGALCEWKMEAGTIPQPRLGFRANGTGAESP